MRPSVRTVANKPWNYRNERPESYLTADIATIHRPGSKAFDMDVSAYEMFNGVPVGTFVYWVDYTEWGKHKPFRRW